MENLNSVLVLAGEERIDSARAIVSPVDVDLRKLQKVIQKYEVIGDS